MYCVFVTDSHKSHSLVMNKFEYTLHKKQYKAKRVINIYLTDKKKQSYVQLFFFSVYEDGPKSKKCDNYLTKLLTNV